MDKKPHRILKRVLFVIAILLLLVIIAGASAVIWYQSNISAKYDVACSKEECVPQKFVVASGDSAQSIAERLESEGIIKSAFAFRIYLTLQASNKNLLPGDYMLTKSMSVEQIVQAMNNGIARPTVSITAVASLQPASKRRKSMPHLVKNIAMSYSALSLKALRSKVICGPIPINSTPTRASKTSL